MDPSTKRQLVGAAVLITLAVIFLPMLFSSGDDQEAVDVPVEVPPREAEDPDPEELAERPPEDVEEPPAELDDEPVDLDERAPEPDHEAQARPEPDAEPDPEPEPEPDTEPDPEPEPEREPAETEAYEVADRDDGAYAAQVGSFRDRSNADSEAERFDDLGLPAFVERGEVGGEPRYRVRLGPVMERAEAEALLERVEAEGDAEGFVVSR